MGLMIVDRVILLLSSEGIPADVSFPPERITRITETVAAVSLEKAELADRTATVLVEILTPKDRGGFACQKKALEACAILESAGAQCSQGSCEFYSKANVFRVSVKAKFRGIARATQMEEMPEYVITTGPLTLRYACGFFAEQKRQSANELLHTAPWEFTVEEFFPWGITDTLLPDEPFDMDVKCNGIVERYENCKWTYRKLSAEELGIRQIRKGTATSRIDTSE